MLFTGLLLMTQPASLEQPRTIRPEMAPYTGLGPPTYIINSESSSQTFCQLRFPSQMILACVKLIKLASIALKNTLTVEIVECILALYKLVCIFCSCL